MSISSLSNVAHLDELEKGESEVADDDNEVSCSDCSDSDADDDDVGNIGRFGGGGNIMGSHTGDRQQAIQQVLPFVKSRFRSCLAKSWSWFVHFWPAQLEACGIHALCVCVCLRRGTSRHVSD